MNVCAVKKDYLSAPECIGPLYVLDSQNLPVKHIIHTHIFIPYQEYQPRVRMPVHLKKFHDFPCTLKKISYENMFFVCFK